jgi:hypothetical protein
MAKPTVAERVAAADHELAAVQRQIAEAKEARERSLLADDDRAASKLAARIDELEATARGHKDKLELLRTAAAEEEREATAKRRAGIVDRFEKLLAEADAEADVLQELIVKADGSFRRIIEMRERARAAWPLSDPHHNMVVGTADGCALSAAAVRILVGHELFRVGHRVHLGGQEGARGEVSWPAPACPDLRLSMLPEKVTPLGAALRSASRYAVNAMRGGKLDPLAAVPIPVGNGAADKHLAALHREQQRLAAQPQTPEVEAAYEKVVAEIAAHGAQQ